MFYGIENQFFTIKILTNEIGLERIDGLSDGC